LAARRALQKRLLRGRSKDQLSAMEKDRIEAQLKSMEHIDQQYLPKIGD